MRSTPWGLLGKLELATLEHLWDHGPADATDVHAALAAAHGITRNTVQSTLSRLHDKQLATRHKVRHAFVYAAAVSREEFQREAVGEVVDALLQGEAGAMVAAFVGVAERAGDETLARLEAEIAARRRALREGES